MVSKDDLTRAIVELNFSGIGDKVQTALNDGIEPMEALASLKKGLDIVGDLYHKREYFLSELFMAGETMSAAMEVLMPTLSKNVQQEDEGKIVIGSIQGDIHDFGKKIAKTFLTASGFTVYDLGIDVPPTKFVDEALRVGAKIIGISAILSSTQLNSKMVIDALKAKGLRAQFKVILGGTGVTDLALEEYGVDAAVNDATEGVNIIQRWMKELLGEEKE